MIDLDTLRKAKGYVLAVVDERTGEYEPVSSDVVQVIRCKDCKHAKKIYLKNLPWLTQWEYSCAYFNTHSVMGDGFCSNAEERRMNKTITLVLDYHASNVLTYLTNKYQTNYAQIIMDALNAYYAEDIKELERKSE